MCGRKTLTKNVSNIIEELIINEWDYQDFSPSYNIAPSQFSPVMIWKNNSRVVKKMRWGFENSWSKTKIPHQIINARSETILDKPIFKNLFYTNRCVIIADGYFEWKTNSMQPYYIFHPKKEILPMAGIWNFFSDSRNNTTAAYTVITTSAQKNINQIHHRMPVILNKENINKWIFNQNNNHSDLLQYLKPFDRELESYPVSTIVNSTTNNNVNCIKKNQQQQLLIKF